MTNLRGIIVPIVDLRIKFNLGSVEYNEQTVVIILNLERRVVDGVSDVLMLNSGQIRPAPEFATLSTEYLTGLGTVDERMLILVDIEDDDQRRNGAGGEGRLLNGAAGRMNGRGVILNPM